MISKEVVIFAPLYKMIPVDGWGGVEKITLERVQFLRRMGFKVQLVANTTQADLADSVLSPNKLFSYPEDKAHILASLATGKWTKYISMFTDLKSEIWEAPILSDASAIDPFNNLLLSNRMGHDRILFYLHGNHYSIYDNWRRLFGLPDKILRVSRRLNFGALNMKMNEFLTYNGFKSHYMPSGTEFPNVKQIVRNPDEFLLFVGTINPLKAPHLAIEISRKVGLPLKIIGRVTDSTYFKNHIKPFLDSNIEYMGEVPRQTLVETLRRSKGLLFTSAWNEPQGIVVLEAQSYGVPVLALNLPVYSGIYEMIDNFQTGFIGSMNDLVIESKKIFEIDREAIYQHSKSKWSWESVLRKYHLNVIEKIADRI